MPQSRGKITGVVRYIPPYVSIFQPFEILTGRFQNIGRVRRLDISNVVNTKVVEFGK